jgi:hypothetical protein
MTNPTNYPEWFYYPSRTRPPDWVHELLDVVSAARPLIDSATVDGLTSDKVLAHLRPGLLKLGYEVEGGKHRADKIRRPVLFGDQGRERVAYEVDAVHDELGILVEVEAGRGARGNAVYRDLVRSSLIVDQRFLVLGVMRSYRHQSSGRPIIVSSYRDSKDQLDALYASGRLRLPFEGVLLFGYWSQWATRRIRSRFPTVHFVAHGAVLSAQVGWVVQPIRFSHALWRVAE